MSDLISRQAAIDAFERIFNRCEEIETHLPDGDPDKTGYRMFPDSMTVWKYLRQLQSAQPERKKGEWVGAHAYCDHLNEEAKANGKTDRYLPSGMVIGVYCDQCWCRADKKSDFCPNCGVDMRGEQDG